MAQTARTYSFLDRPWTLEDVISIPSDSDSGIDSDEEVMGHGVPHVNLVHDQHPDDSLPSISEIVASMMKSRQFPTEDIGENLQIKLQGTTLANTSPESSAQELCVAEDREGSDSSAPNSPREVLFASSVLESPGITTCSDMLVSPASQQHDHAMCPVLSTPIREPCVVSAASQCASAQPGTILPLGDEVLHQQYADSSCQARLSSAANLIQPSQPQNRSIVSSNPCGQIHSINDDHGHMDGVVPQGDDELHGVAQPALTKTPASGCCPMSPKGSSTEVDRQHQAAEDILPLVSCLSPSPNSLRRGKERQTSTNTHHTMSQLDGPYEEMERRPSSRRGSRKEYNLRPLPVKRQFIGEQTRDEGEDSCVAQHKRRKVVFPQPKKRSSQQGKLELPRSRKPRSFRKKTMKDSDNASVADTNRPAHSSVASYEEWSLAHTVLKCNRENGTAMFQLQFTSDTLWKALTAQNGPAPKDHQPPNKVKDRRLRTRKGAINQRTENEGEQSIQAAYPSVCPDIYRMDCLLARWRQHTFLVKWSDATTTWEPRKHILDKRMLDSFEASWQGFDAGVDVLGARLRAGKRQHLLHWHGRPSKEDTWVYDEVLSPQLMGRIQANEINGAHA
ncbi:protein-tyrosine phosphatase [Pochonia chlamydosporia 170]|uniref:Protein-tyrosine phosphatase n=1 Tax=Pochonia chlamydosporia 170 TaxID=1380566 RepID=A0A179F6F8_METCM|nr:protein-tyrosine phosphatase [Pochonia chlamydosporia 170]OAQ60940.1 protein-tyrosine phosphatase [Pochonia chlamydosporia 170]